MSNDVLARLDALEIERTELLDRLRKCEEDIEELQRRGALVSDVVTDLRRELSSVRADVARLIESATVNHLVMVRVDKVTSALASHFGVLA